jgi:fructokinase
MFLICGEALYDMFLEAETPTGLRLDTRMGGSPFNVAIGLACLCKRSAPNIYIENGSSCRAASVPLL